MYTTRKNVNTILLWATLGMLAFISTTSLHNALQLATMQGTLVTRPEVEAKLAEIRASQTLIEKDLTSLKLALAERGISASKQK